MGRLLIYVAYLFLLSYGSRSVKKEIRVKSKEKSNRNSPDVPE